MDDLALRMEKLEHLLKRLVRYVMAHHEGEVEVCEACRDLQGKPRLLDKKQVSRIFDAGNMLDQVDGARKKVFFRNIFNLCQVHRFQEITQDYWSEVEKMVDSVEQEMSELGIKPLRQWKKG